jgi:hypothetical protein
MVATTPVSHATTRASTSPTSSNSPAQKAFTTAINQAKSPGSNTSAPAKQIQQDIDAWNYQQSHSFHNKSDNLKGIQSDVVKVLQGAAASHQIDYVLSQLGQNPNNLKTLDQILDASGATVTSGGSFGEYPTVQPWGLSQDQRNSLFNSMVQNGVSAGNIAKLGQAMSSGQDVAGLLTAASTKPGLIDQVLYNYNSKTLVNQLDYAGLSQDQRNQLFQSMIQGSTQAADPTRPGRAALTNLLMNLNSADAAGFLNAAGKADDVYPLLKGLTQNDVNSLGRTLESGLSQDQRSAVFNSLIQGGASYDQTSMLLNALNNGSDVSGLLTAASTEGEIPQVLASGNLNYNHLAQALDSSGLFNPGLSQNDRDTLFNTIVANGATANELVSLSNAFNKLNDTNSTANIEGLAQAIANPDNHALPQTKIGYIEGLAPQVSGQGSTAQASGLESTSTPGNTQAYAVGAVLASMGDDPRVNTQQIDQLFNDLENSGKLSAVMAAGVANIQVVGRGGGSSHFDASQLDGIINAAARGADPYVKSRVFNYGANAINYIQEQYGWAEQALPSTVNDPAVPTITSALTNLLNSDPRGIVAQQYHQSGAGTAMTTYMSQMIKEGKSAAIAEILKPLLTGPDPQHVTPEQYLNQQTSAGYTHADELGFLVGAIEAGVYKNNQDATTTTNTITNILTTATGVGLTFGPGNKALANALKATNTIASAAAKQQASQIAKAAFGEDAAIQLDQQLLTDWMPDPNHPKTEWQASPGADEFRNAVDQAFLDDSGLAPKTPNIT